MNAKQIDKALRRFEKLYKPKPDKLAKFVKSIDRQLDKLLEPYQIIGGEENGL